jgi:uncharacterized protein YwqG
MFSDYRDPHDTFPHCSLTFEVKHFLGIPSYKPAGLEQMNDQDFVRVCRELRESFPLESYTGSYKVKHQLLEYPSPLQNGDMERTCHLVSQGLDESWEYSEEIEEGANDWLLLAQIDSDEKLDWNLGDAGRLFFWIKQQELKQQDFSNVWFEFESA